MERDSMAHVLIIDPRRREERFALERSSTRIGRLADNDLVVPDRTASRREHCRIDLRKDGHHYLRHVQGRNPTRLNGIDLAAPTRLYHRDEIGIGRWTLVFLERDEPAAYLSDDSPGMDSDITAIPAGDMLSGPASPYPEAMEVVLEADRQLTLQRPLDDIFGSLLDLARRLVTFDRGVLMLLEGNRPVSRHVVVADGEKDDSVAVSREIVNRVADHGEAVLVRDTRRDVSLARRDSIDKSEVRALMCVPLIREENVEGLMYLDSRRKNRRFNRENLRILVHLASVAAAKIENRRLFERTVENRILLDDLGRAADIQQHLLPHEEPRIEGYAVVGRTVPCMGVGGDWYDWMSRSDGKHCFCLGDIVGKGLSAAMLMSSAHASLQALTQAELSPSDAVTRLNALVEKRFPYNRFVTLWYATLDPRAHELTYVNACQERPFHVTADGSVQPLETDGSPVGMMDDTVYESKTIAIGPGDMVVVYSDGFINCRNPSEDFFGEDRLLELVESVTHSTPTEMAETLLEAVNDYRGERPHEDDITLLLLKRLASSRGPRPSRS
jgi:sigma-B regulation protein RsbU (phosphoserine phosphatase)